MSAETTLEVANKVLAPELVAIILKWITTNIMAYAAIQTILKCVL